MSNAPSAVQAFSLKNAPSLIEHVFPSMKVSAEAQKERKGVQSQTLTALGSYWKGRKPLVLVKACILGSLLPSTLDSRADLEVFELLMGIDDASFEKRVVRPADYPGILDLPYEERLEKSRRPEELGAEGFSSIWTRVNKHLGTRATSFAQLVEQLGIMRFGHRTLVSDTFSGGGSIPFEASRLGCDVIASDLNPVACMLTWASRNIVGADEDGRRQISAVQQDLVQTVERKMDALAVELDGKGNRAKAYLYCLEVKCPSSGWSVPLLPTMVVSKTRMTVVKLVADHENRRYDFLVETGIDAQTMAASERGTLIEGRVIHPMGPADGVSVQSIRGDRRGKGDEAKNDLRHWTKDDFRPRANDIFQERLYCIQWMANTNTGRPNTFFAAPTEADIQREREVERLVEKNLAGWQEAGYVPSAQIVEGEKTSEPIRTRGWTHWHHLFSPRQLLFCAMVAEHAQETAVGTVGLLRMLDWSTKLCRYGTGAARESISQTFYNQAFNTFYNYGVRPFGFAKSYLAENYNYSPVPDGSKFDVLNVSATVMGHEADIFITDPPYADAVNYHEISEFFIAWMKKNQPDEFARWNWDSRRLLAIKGKDEDFRTNMVAAYRNMTDHMPDNGVQIVMFTHQDGKVWSDMAQIFWGAGLQVMADWYIATETTTELKKGGYVQGTHIIVLRKRAGAESGYSDEITQEVKDAVARQIEEMVGLNQSLRGHGRSENLFNDADLQMAGYAAALRVLTKYVRIDGKDMTVEALRPRAKNERTVIDDIIEYAVQVANEHLVPEGMAEQTWRKLTGTERFYLKMMDIETTGSKKVDNYQNFAKAFRVADYGALMSSVAANSATLKSAADLGKRQMGEDEFGSSMTRAILYVLWEMKNGVGDDEVLGHLRDLSPDYLNQRGDLQAIADYIAAKRKQIDVTDSQNATILAGLIKNERLG